MLINAYQYITQSEKDVLPDLLKLFNDVALGVCEGQQYDMDFEDRGDVTVDEYIEMIRLKNSYIVSWKFKGWCNTCKSPLKKDADLI